MIIFKGKYSVNSLRPFCATFFLAACTGGVNSGPVSVSVASSVTAPNEGGSAESNSQLHPSQQALLQLTPAFSTLIHDYVVPCAASPDVQVTVQVPANVAVGLIDPLGVAVAAKTYPNGEFQQALTILPGQRFQFSLSGQPDNYSVRCTPADFPALKSASGIDAGLTGILANYEVSRPEAQWYVFAPSLQITSGVPVPSSYVIIADANGTPVWWKHEPLGEAFDAKLLAPGQITWGVFGQGGFGQGEYVIRDFAGNVLNVISGDLDVHDLQPTPKGTYLAIRDVGRICPPDCADMSPWGGSAEAGVEDAEILELDSQSNVLWTWRTRDHITLAETGAAGWFPSIGGDIIHMNGLEPDGDDGVIFSARYLNAIYHITKSTGSIDWKIGGTMRAESLTVVGDTRPTALGPVGQTLSGQHDVRKWTDGTVSVHDNGTIANRPPFIVRYQIDLSSKTAEVVEEFTDSRITAALCCGSARRLPHGHWLVDWGGGPLVTEFDSKYVPVMTIQNLSTGVFSYRAVPIEPGMISADSLRKGMDVMSATED